ncbi:MAG: class II aldolase/adducin family protein [Candidatus Zixiibacteriota bacterium]
MEQGRQHQLRQRLAEIGRNLYLRGYVSGSDGNLSVRLTDKRILITCAGSALGELEPEHLVEVNSSADANAAIKSGKAGELQPSSELAMHLEVYRRRADIQACVHSHAPYATAYAVAGVEPDQAVLPEVVAFVGPIRLTRYARAGTADVGKSLAPHLDTSNAFLLKNHGLLTLGRCITEAHRRHEIVENYLKILTIARGLGAVDSLPESELAHLRTLLETKA